MDISQNYYLTQLLYIFVAILGISWFIQYHYKRRNLYKYASKVSGPRGWPIIGNVLDFTTDPCAIYNRLIDVFADYPNLNKFWYGSLLFFSVSKPEYLEKVLCSPSALPKMYFYKYARTAVGHGLFSAPGIDYWKIRIIENRLISVSVWKRHRKVILPTFNQKILDSFIPIFQKHANVMSQQLEKYRSEEEFDFFDAICKCTLDIICETAMGVEINSQISNAKFGHWIDRIMEIMFIRMYNVLYHFDLIYRRTQMYREEKELVEKFHTFTNNIIREKRANGSSSDGKKIFLDHLIDQDALTDEELRDEVNTFIIAGSDTTAATLGYIFLMLGMHKDVQERVYQEVEDLAHYDLSTQDISNMKYTERVIKETLRLFPVGPFIVRNVEGDIALDDDLILPEGSFVLLGIIAAQRNPEYWENPLEFNPDRFLPEEISKRHPYTFIPFSGGLRTCVGPKYAMMSMKIVIATILQKYEIFTSYRSVEEINLKINLTLKPVNGFKVSVKLR